MAPHSIWFLSTWIAGGVLAFFGAMAYAELAALRPRAGGEYVYLREAYGPLAGIMPGWSSFVAGSALASGAVVYFGSGRASGGVLGTRLAACVLSLVGATSWW